MKDVIVRKGDVLMCGRGHRWEAPGDYSREEWLEGGQLDDSGHPILECHECSGTMIVGGWGVDRRNQRIGELIGLGLHAVEADVIASIEAGERPVDIAARRGVARQTINQARRRGLNRLAERR